MTLDLPFWFKQRQAKAEDLGNGMWKVTGPNLPEAIIGVRMEDNLRWRAFVRTAPEAPELVSSEPTLETARDGLAAAFELYRVRFVN
jgi:hypothetical protein